MYIRIHVSVTSAGEQLKQCIYTRSWLSLNTTGGGKEFSELDIRMYVCMRTRLLKSGNHSLTDITSVCGRPFEITSTMS